MKAVIQRVSSASVKVGVSTVGRIGPGLLVLLGVGEDDGPEDLTYIIDKLTKLRIFDDDDGKMNLSLLDVGGEVLAVSQFTLYADTRKGRRPSYVAAAKPDKAQVIYNDFVVGLRQLGIATQTGVFGAHMEVSLVNDGPVTIIMDSRLR